MGDYFIRKGWTTFNVSSCAIDIDFTLGTGVKILNYFLAMKEVVEVTFQRIKSFILNVFDWYQ